MYSTEELARLGRYKATLQHKSTRRRSHCAAAARTLTKPLLWLDGTLGFCRGVAPLVKAAALPVGFVVARQFFPRVTLLRSIVRWGPLAFTGLRGIASLLQTQPQATAPHQKRR